MRELSWRVKMIQASEISSQSLGHKENCKTFVVDRDF